MSERLDPPTVPQLLVQGLDLPPLDAPPQPIGRSVTCFSGETITQGYRASDLLTAATSEFLDTFGTSATGWISESAARAIKAASPKAGNLPGKSTLVFADGTCWQPLIDRGAAAKQGRACWSDLARQIWPDRAGDTLFGLITTDTKRRLWPKGRVGVLGERTPFYLHADWLDVSDVVFLDWPALLEALDLVEETYTLGFSKFAIRDSLFTMHARAVEHGWRRVAALEGALRPLRHRPEFTVALLIAQRKDA